MTRKLIEVALPLEAINRESAREKSIRHGHPSTLHLWWARRPLAACRAVIFASLVDDPSAHPQDFPTDEAQEAERQRLFRIIEDLVRWDNTTNETVLDAARAEIMRSCGGNPPPVMDPFCGGGSIPLEAQRLGLEAHGSDLNPVAVLITKALVEIPPHFAGQPPVHLDAGRLATGAWKSAQGLAQDVRYYGRWMRDEAQRRIGALYPKATLPDGSSATVIAWIWARTVRSPNPAWDGPMPLVRSFALSTKKGKETWAQPIVDRENRTIRFEIRTCPGCPEGTVGRNGAVCLATGTPVPLSYIRAEGKAGRMGAQLMAIVAEGHRSRVYLPPDEEHDRVARSAVPPDDVPDTDLPLQALGFRVQAYGMTKHRHLFTDRQLVALCCLSDRLVEARPVVFVTDPPYYDNIGYADLSDFFYVWLRRSLKSVHPDLFSTLLVPKVQELVADPYRHDGDKHAAEKHFESGIGVAFERMRRTQAPGLPLTIIYAFKQAEEADGAGSLASTGWETMLEGLSHAGLSVHGTWPLRSELGNRPRSQGSNALASSIALVCRPRPNDAPLATRKDLVAALKAELPQALRNLQQGNIAPVDLAQSVIGPGMGVFSRYAKVVETDGSAMSVRTALGLINGCWTRRCRSRRATSTPTPVGRSPGSTSRA